jgi:hypothetical protein
VEAGPLKIVNVSMKLDVNVLRYLGKDDFRTLTAVEMGQKNVREVRDLVLVWFDGYYILSGILFPMSNSAAPYGITMA